MNKYKLKLSIVNCQLSIIAAMLLLIGCQQSEELHTAPSPIQITVTPPPAWNGTATRATPVVWTDSDQLRGTITFIHASGLKDAPVPFVYNLADKTFAAPTPTWPVGQDIDHAILTGTYGIDADGNRIDGTIPIYHAKGEAKAGKAFVITLTHGTAGIDIIGFESSTVTVGNLNATVPADGNLTLYPVLEADATEIEVIVGTNTYTIAVGKGGPLGKMYKIIKEKIGATNPGNRL